MSLHQAAERLIPPLEQDLRRLSQAPHQSLAGYYGMMHYHMGWVDEALQPLEARGGKRIRPLLCLMACEATGADPLQALPAASALELVHNFSLVHDDIQDASPLRRGRPTVWRLWGPAQAITVGDGLFVLARLSLQRLADQGLPLSLCQAALNTFDQTCLALCEGQYLDISFEQRLDIHQDQYLWMIHQKTAALLAACAQLGALAGRARAETSRCLHLFGENLGMAFQIEDDILGTWGDAQRTGKSTATDIRDKKKTLPVVYALNHPDRRQDAQELAELFAQPGALDEGQIDLALACLERTSARPHAEEMAEGYYRQALDSLSGSGLPPAALQDLHELAASLLGRDT
jgi:geranylgeranyl diphosphate synthase, type I